MTRGKPLTEDDHDAIRAAFLLTDNSHAIARMTGFPVSTVNDYVRNNRESLRMFRTEKAPELTERIDGLLDFILNEAFDPSRVSSAKLSELMTGIGILVDKRQLLTGKPTARTETGPIDPGKLTPEEREAAARIREKLAAEVPR